MKWKSVTWLRFSIGMIVFLPLFWLMIALRTGSLANYIVTSSSMEPTLYQYDRVIMRERSESEFKRGDVIVLEDPTKSADLLTKRIVALPGDTVEVKNGLLSINGEVQTEPYITKGNLKIKVQDTGPIEIPPGQVFVLGDNRNFSMDSLNFGPAPLSSAKGTLALIYWPPSRSGEIK